MTSHKPRTIKVGFTEAHGMPAEQFHYPPEGVEFSFLQRLTPGSRVLQSPIKGFMSEFNFADCDIIESVISPVATALPWVYSLACYQEPLAFSFFGLPSPKPIRSLYMERLLRRDNCKKLVFWSQAGLNTLHSYGKVTDSKILQKSVVVYPAVREIDAAAQHKDSDSISILFSGDFFRKGGANVIDAFEQLQKSYSNIQLRLCCDEKIDFNTSNTALKEKYLNKIRSNKNIVFGRVPREVMIGSILPATDIYLLPTYTEAFGFAILEAMAFGIPVISTNYMAIPEIIEAGETGFMIDIEKFDTENMFKGYVVDNIPEEFNRYMTQQLHNYLGQLIDSAALRQNLGVASIEVARTKFSFSRRNQQMRAIYEEALEK